MRNFKYLITLIILGTFGVHTNSMSSEADIPHTFVSGTKAVASEVNENFTAMKTAIDDNNARIAMVESQKVSGFPVRCRVWINVDLTDQNVPMECNTPDGAPVGPSFTNVPEGYYLYVTDIIVKPRLTSQTTVAASVRIWEESGGSDVACSGGGVVGSFVTDSYITLADTSIEGQAHLSFNSPYLVLTPNDCLAVYTSTPSGLITELSGYLYDRLH